MRWIRSFSPMLLCLAIGNSAPVAVAREVREQPDQVLAQLREEPDQRLSDYLDELLLRSNFRDEFEYEACLTEIVRRGRDPWAGILRKRFDALLARRFKLYEQDEDPEPGSHFNLELLTALRRVDGRPDPLQISLELPLQKITATPLSLPDFRVAIQNVDVERQDVGFTFGGDYRGGRQARWHLVVTDANGRPVPPRVQHGLRVGGGQFRRGVLRHGESWETVLDMRRFISTPQPGTYSLQVLYHDNRARADMEDISGLIVSKSARIPFIVEPAVIQLTPTERRAALRWIGEIDPTRELKVVAGTYGEWAHEFIRPDSAQGKLLKMRLKSVPPLIEALRDERLEPKRRAWILSLLFSVTGEQDPRSGAILGDYEYLEAPWEVWEGRPGESSEAAALPSRGSSRGGEINLQRQLDISNKWVEWLQSVKVHMKMDD